MGYPVLLIQQAHELQVLEFYEFLRADGVDALIDVEVAGRPRYWPDWMSAQIRPGGYVLVIGSLTMSQVGAPAP
jgi:hypothetical protein